MGVNFLVCESKALTEILNLRYGIYMCKSSQSSELCFHIVCFNTLQIPVTCVPGMRKFHLQHWRWRGKRRNLRASKKTRVDHCTHT